MQIQLGEGGAFGPGLDVVVQVLQIIIPIGFVLGVELDHPGGCFQFVEGVLQRVFQRITDFAQPVRVAALGANGGQLEESRAGYAVLQQHGLLCRQVVDPGQQVDEGSVDVVQAGDVGGGGRFLFGIAPILRRGDALRGQALEVAIRIGLESF